MSDERCPRCDKPKGDESIVESNPLLLVWQRWKKGNPGPRPKWGDVKAAIEADQPGRCTEVTCGPSVDWRARCQEATRERAKLAALYTTCELALHDAMPDGATYAHFIDGVRLVVEHVKTLTRERDEARRELHELEDAVATDADNGVQTEARLTRERDEARAALLPRVVTAAWVRAVLVQVVAGAEDAETRMRHALGEVGITVADTPAAEPTL